MVFDMKRFLFIAFIFILTSCLYPGRYRDPGMFKNLQYRENALHNRDTIVKTAMEYIGVKYKRGGTTPDGFDCSGFVFFVFHKNGIQLPRSAAKQYYTGKYISEQDMKPGDLVFYQTETHGIDHVGIFVGGDQFIHAPSTGKGVRVVNMLASYWKERYIGSITFFY
jgi:cell wall-associated NlpC family hydrolase